MRGKPSTCCFTGHRPEKLPWGSDETDPRCKALKQKLQDAVSAAYDEGMRHFICGMARGCDFYFAEAVLALRADKQDVTLEAAVPAPPRRTTGRRRISPGGGPCWPPATWKLLSRTTTRQAVCSAATGTWWTTAPWSSPFTTAQTAVPAGPWSTLSAKKYRLWISILTRSDTRKFTPQVVRSRETFPGYSLYVSRGKDGNNVYFTCRQGRFDRAA